jgi:spermidine/putrescine-binding protein
MIRGNAGAALKLKGHLLNTDDRGTGRSKNLLQQKPLVKMYNSATSTKFAQRNIWLAQGWSGQFARARSKPDPHTRFQRGSAAMDRLSGNTEISSAYAEARFY